MRKIMRWRYVIYICAMILVILFLYCSRNLQSQHDNQKVTVEDSSLGGKVLKDSLYHIEMVYIPAGTIKYDADYERHEMLVFLKSFYIGKYEVTQAQWEAVMGNNPSMLRMIRKKNPEFADAVKLLVTKINRSKGTLGSDIHEGNIMIRFTSTGPQIVLSDPIV